MNTIQRHYALQHLENITGARTNAPEKLISECFNALSSAVDGDTARPYLDEQALGLGSVTRFGPTRWPNGCPFAICLTHDVDRTSHFGNFWKLGRRLRRLVAAKGPLGHKLFTLAGATARLCLEPFSTDDLGRFERWLDLEQTLGFRSTWYFLPERIDPVHAYDSDYAYADAVTFRGSRMAVRELMREIDSAGGEIGLHGSYLSWRDSDVLAAQRSQVEDAICRSVRSVRQHYLHYSHENTPPAHEAAGFVCDSSVGLRAAVGFPSGTAFPYWCWNHGCGQPSRVLEIPLHIMDTGLFHAANASGSMGLKLATRVMDRAASVGGCVTVNWHPEYVRRPGYFEVYRDLIQEAHSRGAWGCGAAALYEWWGAMQVSGGAPVADTAARS